ncbi:MAG: hypothetical protein KKA19_01535, partial [Candidatus Margulisbacteria bacterium]|nr:hypothetical protein [Candidatus Margulisiibacteriota bacterium]
MDRFTGTRAMAMGGAFVAIADDLSAPYWNPAGLGLIKSHQLGTTYMSLFEMADRLSIDGVYHLKDYQGSLGINYVQEGMQNIPKTENMGGTGIQIGSFDEYKRAFNLGFGQEFQRNLYWGSNLRFLYNSLDTEIAYGGSWDLGFLWDTDHTLYVGIVARNIFSRLIWSTSEIEYFDKKVIAGVAIKEKFFQIPSVFAFDYEVNPNYKDKWYAGAEFWLVEDFFAFRFGTNIDERWTFGLGLKYFNFTCDF